MASDYGVFNPKMVDAKPHKLTNARISAPAGAGAKDLKNQPDAAMTVIRGMKFTGADGWKSVSESAFRQRVR